jgi:hypothetical protein
MGAPIPPRREHRGAIVMGRLGVSRGEDTGVALQSAPRIPRIGSVVGYGDVQRARGAIGQLAIEETVAIRHISQVVTDVLSGAGDPEGDVAVGNKSATGDEVPWALIAEWQTSEPRPGYLTLGWAWVLPPTCWARAVVDAVVRSSISGPERDQPIRGRCARCASVETKPLIWLGEPQGWRSGTPMRYFEFSC